MPARSRTPSGRQTKTTANATSAESDPAAEADSGSFPVAIVLSVVALAVAGLALAWSVFLSGPRGADDCQDRAWDSIPEERDLPAGWRVAATSFFVGNMTVTLEGPAADAETGEGVVYTTVTCYGTDGAEALARARAADASSGSPTTDLEGIGEEGYQIDDDTGLSAIHFRRGDLVSYLVVAGNVTPEELRAAGEAFDQAMIDAKAGDIPPIEPAGTPGPGTGSPGTGSPGLEPPVIEPSGLASESPAESPAGGPASPELDALLPKDIGGTQFLVETYRATDVLGDDVGSRAVTAGLRQLGRAPEELELAEVYDANRALDLYLFAFRLPDADPEALKSLVLDSWLVAGADGVTAEEVELGGKTLTRVRYGEEFPDAYLYSVGDVAVIIHTGSEDLAAEAAAALPTSADQP
jgi:hypothetical protein